jgi:hypothetical protein
VSPAIKISQLLATDIALDKLGARGISAHEAEQLPRNRHALVRNPREGSEPRRRMLLIGRTDGGRPLTLVIERTVDPTTWLVVTGWASTDAERKIVESQR